MANKLTCAYLMPVGCTTCIWAQVHGIRNGINFPDIRRRNGADFQDFGIKHKVCTDRSGILFEKLL